MAFLFTADALIYTFPHLTYGRYPDSVGGVSTTDIYAKHAKDLEKLKIETNEACTFLADVAESLSKMRGK